MMQVKNNSKLKDAIVRSVALLQGQSAASHYQVLFDSSQLHLPSDSSLSRARLKVDILLCLWHHAQVTDPSAFFVYLSSDSSPQGGYELLMTLQDVCSRTMSGF